MLLQQLAEVAQVVTEPLGRHRGVLPALVRLVATGRIGGRAQAGLADVLELLLDLRVLGVGDVRPGMAALAVDLVDQRVRPVVGLFLGVPA